MEERFAGLLRELFEGDSDALREQLKPLDTAQRRALFRDFKGLLPVLRRACKYHFTAKRVKLSELYRAIQADPAMFLQQQAQDLAAPGTLNNGIVWRDLPVAGFFTRLQTLQVGLASKSGVGTGFRRSHEYPQQWNDRYFLRMGRVLLDRPEPWVLDVLIKVYDTLERRVQRFGNDGVARLLQEARTLHPEWSEALAPFCGKAMHWDGFRAPVLDQYDADMILAGLEYQSQDQEVVFEPILVPEIVEVLLHLLNSDRLPRAPLLELSLRMLQSPLRPSVARGWVAFCQRLELSDEEYARHTEWFVDMLNAPTTAAAQLALQVTREHYLQDPERAGELLGVLGYVLHQPTQTTAQNALRLIKKLVKLHPGIVGQAYYHAVEALDTPHRKLREELIAWLRRGTREELGAEAQVQLRAMTAVLPAAEAQRLAHLLDQPIEPAAVAAAPITPVLSRAELTERVATAHGAPADQTRQRQLDFLEQYLESGDCVQLVPTPPDHSGALRAADFALHGSALALAMDMANVVGRVFKHADYDRILAGLLTFRQPDEPERIAEILGPLLSRLDEWRQPRGFADQLPGPFNELVVLLLAHAWLGDGEALVFPRRSFGWRLFDRLVDPALRRRVRHAQKLTAAGHDEWLSTPTQAAGWLNPEVFAERCKRFPPDLIDQEDLADALYRLPALAAPRAAAWRTLELPLREIAQPFKAAITLALAPDESAEQALKRFFGWIRRAFPGEPLLRSGVQSGDVVSFWGRFSVAKRASDLSKNLLFRLFVAALRCRFGLEDDGVAARAPALLAKLANGGWSGGLGRRAGFERALAAELLFHPRPVFAQLIQRLFSTEQHNYIGFRSDYPPLLAYCLCYPFVTLAAPEQMAVDLAYRFPTLAQRLFEAGVYRQDLAHDLDKELSMELLALGRLPQVVVGPYLPVIVQGVVKQAKPEQRERCIDLLVQWLGDGRATPAALAAALAQCIHDTGRGFSYLDQALVSLAVSGEAGRAVVLLAIEQTLARGVGGFAPKKLSTLLDRYTDLLAETGRCVQDADARAVLDTLAQRKKRSVSRDKARLLLELTHSDEQLPLAVLAVSALVFAGDQ